MQLTSQARFHPWFVTGIFALILASCGGRGVSKLSVTIDDPTAAGSWHTTHTSVVIGGTISGASFVHVSDTTTGSTAEGSVHWYQGNGTWSAQVSGLAAGDNLLVATADATGTGGGTAKASIVVTRPAQPATLLINGQTRATTSTYWNTGSPWNYAFALYADGTGRSTTGSSMRGEVAGPPVDITWILSAPDAITILNCPTCSFQVITRISGSAAEATAYGQITTVGGDGYKALDYFALTSGTL